MEGIYGKNKDYLSFSAIDTWLKNKDEYRRRYYGDKVYFSNRYTKFGNYVHDKLENDKDFLPEIDRKGLREQSLDVEIDGVMIKAYIDYIDLRTPLIRDYKTGKTRWTPARVQKHEQLPFYSLLCEQEYGIRINNTDILWLETKEKKEVMGHNGIVLENEPELYLTGHYEIIPRKVFQYERDSMRKLIKNVAMEIALDFAEYKKANDK